MHEAERYLERESQLAEEIREPHARWLTEVHHYSRAIVRGRIGEAAERAESALLLGQEAGQPDAFTVWAGQMFFVQLWQGRVGEWVPVLEQTAESNPGIPAFRSGLAQAYCEVGRQDEAGALLDQEAGDRFEGVPMDLTWLGTLVGFGKVASQLHHIESAVQLYELMAPFGDQVATNGAVVFGTVANVLGGLAAALRRGEESDHWFAAATVLEESMDAPLLRADTLVRWARALAERQSRPDERKAVRLAKEAKLVASELGCRLVADAADLLVKGASRS
jgi:hypothetical protein